MYNIVLFEIFLMSILIKLKKKIVLLELTIC